MDERRNKMKEIQIVIRIDEKSGKIATAWKTSSYSSESISDQFEIMGILENTKNIISDKIKKLMEKKL